MRLQSSLGVTGLLACIAFAVRASGCAVYDDSLLAPNGPGNAGLGGSGSEPGDAGAPDGAAGAGGGGRGGSGAGGSSSSCDSLNFPAQPAVADAGGNLQIIGAVRILDFGDEAPEADAGDDSGTSDAGAHPELQGYDLDHTCTASDTTGPFKCQEPPWATAPHVDGPRGQDNAVGAMIHTITTQYHLSFASSNTNAAIARGDLGIVFRIKDYNGQADDDQVEYDFYVAAPFVYGVTDDAGSTVPRWDGTDRWPIASDSVFPLPEDAGGKTQIDYPVYSDKLAFVTNHVLVASLPTVAVRLNIALAGSSVDLQMNLKGAGVTSEIYETGVPGLPRFSLRNARLAGIWNSRELLATIGQFDDPTAGAGMHVPLCIDRGETYCVFKNVLCSFVDISTDTTAGKACDALSLGLRLESVPALIGDVYDVQPYRSRCKDPNLDPANDTCEVLAELDGGCVLPRNVGDAEAGAPEAEADAPGGPAADVSLDGSDP